MFHGDFKGDILYSIYFELNFDAILRINIKLIINVTNN